MGRKKVHYKERKYNPFKRSHVCNDCKWFRPGFPTEDIGQCVQRNVLLRDDDWDDEVGPVQELVPVPTIVYKYQQACDDLNSKINEAEAWRKLQAASSIGAIKFMG